MKRRPVPRERIEQQQVLTLLRSVGAAAYSIGTTRRRGEWHGTMMSPGIPDIYALLPARPGVAACGLWVEVKAAGGRLRAEQAVFREGCLAAGIPHVVGGANDVIAFLARGGWVKADQFAHYRQPPTASRQEE